MRKGIWRIQYSFWWYSIPIYEHVCLGISQKFSPDDICYSFYKNFVIPYIQHADQTQFLQHIPTMLVIVMFVLNGFLKVNCDRTLLCLDGVWPLLLLRVPWEWVWLVPPKKVYPIFRLSYVVVHSLFLLVSQPSLPIRGVAGKSLSDTRPFWILGRYNMFSIGLFSPALQHLTSGNTYRGIHHFFSVEIPMVKPVAPLILARSGKGRGFTLHRSLLRSWAARNRSCAGAGWKTIFRQIHSVQH